MDGSTDRLQGCIEGVASHWPLAWSGRGAHLRVQIPHPWGRVQDFVFKAEMEKLGGWFTQCQTIGLHPPQMVSCVKQL